MGGGGAQPAVRTCWTTGTDRDGQASRTPGQQRHEDLDVTPCLWAPRGASYREHALRSFMFGF